jgi:cobalt-precorrin-5B (C1)-methyltransferase
VLGGLSILGTSGIVRPLSHQAYKETIEAALSVARAAGPELVLSTGGKSERFARRLLTTLPEECFVQVADFYGFGLKAAAKLGFTKVTHSVFIGKLVKMAMGLHYTHASSANMDLGIFEGDGEHREHHSQTFRKSHGSEQEPFPRQTGHSFVFI